MFTKMEGNLGMKLESSDYLWQYIKGFQYAQNYAELYFKSVKELTRPACGDCVQYQAWEAMMNQMFNKLHLIHQNMVEEFRMLKTYEVSGHLPPYKVRKRKFLSMLRKAKHRVKTVYRTAIDKFWEYHDMAA